MNMTPEKLNELIVKLVAENMKLKDELANEKYISKMWLDRVAILINESEDKSI